MATTDGVVQETEDTRVDRVSTGVVTTMIADTVGLMIIMVAGNKVMVDVVTVPRDDGPPAFPTQPPYTAYVGNLPFDKIESDLEELFSGMAISSVRLMRDRDTGSSKGFGYVEFSDDASLREALNGKDVGGRSIRVDVAQEIEGEIVTALAVEALVAMTMTHDTAISKGWRWQLQSWLWWS